MARKLRVEYPEPATTSRVGVTVWSRFFRTTQNAAVFWKSAPRPAQGPPSKSASIGWGDDFQLKLEMPQGNLVAGRAKTEASGGVNLKTVVPGHLADRRGIHFGWCAHSLPRGRWTLGWIL